MVACRLNSSSERFQKPGGPKSRRVHCISADRPFTRSQCEYRARQCGCLLRILLMYGHGVLLMVQPSGSVEVNSLARGSEER
jgi:hypothetical protein